MEVETLPPLYDLFMQFEPPVGAFVVGKLSLSTAVDCASKLYKGKTTVITVRITRTKVEGGAL